MLFSPHPYTITMASLLVYQPISANFLQNQTANPIRQGVRRNAARYKE